MSRIPSHRIAIIGAGISGLAAASTLSKMDANYNIHVYESTDRIGGRIKSSKIDGNYIDLGPQYIHGEKDNPLNTIAVEAEIKLDSWDDETEKFKMSNGNIIETSVVDMVRKMDLPALEDIDESTSPDVTAATVVEMKVNKYLRECNHENIDTGIIKALIDFEIKFLCLDCAINNLSEVSAVGAQEFVFSEGSYLNNVVDGFVQLVDLIYKSTTPATTYHLNTRIERVQWDDSATDAAATGGDSSGVRLYAADNRCLGTFDAVVVTLPLGVLQRWAAPGVTPASGETATASAAPAGFGCFVPALPPRVTTAIQSIGFGVLNKIFVAFDRPLSPPRVAIVWLDEDELELDAEITSQWSQAHRHWYKNIPHLVVHPQPHVLYCAIYGDAAVFMESLSESTIGHVCERLARRFMDDASECRAVSVVRSQWKSDPNFLGSYSHLPPGVTAKNAMGELSKPIPSAEDPRILLAGEATHPNYYSATHGAYLSGIRAANLIHARVSDHKV